MLPLGMRKRLPWVWRILCTFSALKVLWIQNGRSLLSQDQSFARRCLFRWYSTGHLTCVIQGMISCVTLLRRTSESVDQSKLVLLNVKIMSRESPIRNTLMKKNQEEPKQLGYALGMGIWCYWRNIWIAWRGCIWRVVKCVEKKHTCSVRSARSMFVSRVERTWLVCRVALISMMILCMV